MHEETLTEIADFIYKRSRLCFPGRKRSLLRMRIQDRIERVQVANIELYWEMLQGSAEEVNELLDSLTVNETFFFRNQGQFDFLTSHIVPELQNSKGYELWQSWGSSLQAEPKSIMRIRILSAGCSTGEEPYSIAMALLESLRYPKAWDIEIVAGDISETCLRTASRGFYEGERLRTVPPELLNKYFDIAPDGYYISDDVKKLVRFTQLNLHDVITCSNLPVIDDSLGKFDIIFCRNVMIYFSPKSQQQLVTSLYGLLVEGGYLFTGDAEPLHLFDHGFKIIDDNKSLVYKKSGHKEKANVAN